MSNFLLLFRGGDARAKEQSPEEMQAHMQKKMGYVDGRFKRKRTN